ncbi:histidine kinase dimerization/phospho-acceptor domain-containing protein, partial [Pseudomonas sp. FSL R10-2172]
ADASHELRTPLTSMRTNVELAISSSTLVRIEVSGVRSSWEASAMSCF